ncbi:MAG: LysE family translocator [Actinomycetota bacterium]
MPPIENLIAFSIAALVIILIPGPSVMFAVGRSLALGKGAGVLTVVGNAIGTVVWLIAVVLGLGAIVASSQFLFYGIKYAGAAYLAYLGIQAFRHRNDHGFDVDATGAPQSKFKTLREGFFVGLSNPKTMVFFTAVLPGFVDVKQGNVMLQLLILGIIFEVIGILSDSMYAIGAGLARDWFARDPKRIGIVQGTGGLMIVGLAIWVAFFDSL